MLDPNHPIAELLRRDTRYHFDAYLFIFEALRYAHDQLEMGTEHSSQQDTDSPPGIHELGFSGIDPEFPGDLDSLSASGATENPDSEGNPESEPEEPEQHISGQELCEAMRLYAHEQYGYLAKNVLNHWGLESTSDFGEIVFNLIEIGQMRKTASDTREDFNGVFDFDEGFQHSYEISLPDSSEERRS